MSVQLIAHRGYTARYPENTIIAIKAAIDAGAAFVEVDVQLAADATPVLFHDRALNRMCNTKGAIADYSAQQLASLSATDPDRFGDTFAGTPIATLESLAKLIRQHPQVHFFIELKRISIKHHGAECVLKQTTQTLKSLQRQCTLISFDADILAMARLQQWRTGWIVEHWEEQEKGLLFCDVEALPRSGNLHRPDIQLAVYEVGTPEQALQLSARGVDFVETFAIGEMQEALSKP